VFNQWLNFRNIFKKPPQWLNFFIIIHANFLSKISLKFENLSISCGEIPLVAEGELRNKSWKPECVWSFNMDCGY
jgi:hypothetical protein